MNCVFIVIVFMCGNLLSAMEITTDQPNKKFPSLKKLCIQRIVKSVTTAHEELGKFAQGTTRYHMVPEELQQVIMKKLPNRPRCPGIIPYEFYPCCFNKNDTSSCCIGGKYSRNTDDDIIDSKTILVDVNSGLSLYEFKRYYPSYTHFDRYGRLFVESGGGHAYFGYFQAAKNKEQACPVVDWVELWNGRGRRHVPPFTSRNNELIVNEVIFGERSRKISLLNFVTGHFLYKNAKAIQECAEKNWMLVLDRNHVLRIIDRDAQEECHVFDNTSYFLISPNGTFLLREDRSGQKELINFDTNSKRSVRDMFGGLNVMLLYHNPVFSENNRYLMFCDYAFDLLKIIDLQSHDFSFCKCVDGWRDYRITFSEQGNYLVWSRRVHDKKLQDGVLNQLIVKIEDIFNDEKDEFSIEDLCGLEGSISGSYSKLIYVSPDEKYVCQFHNDHAELIDIKTSCVVMKFDDIGLYACPDIAHWYQPFNATGKIIVLPPCVSDKNKVCVVHLENDLTIDQFLLKRLICERCMTREQISENTWLSAIYAGLTQEQKEYFDAYVFA